MRRFNQETSINSIKRVAREMLYSPVEVDDFTKLLVYHPVFTTIYTTVCVDGKNVIADITTEEGLDLARNYYLQFIETANRYDDFFRILRSSYLPLFFKNSSLYFSREDYSSFLAEMWTRVEFPNNSPDCSIQSFVTAFSNSDKTILMNEKERKLLSELPDEVVVYRGVKPNAKVKALSWTLSHDTAKWFADRFEKNGIVYRARIKKEDILAYFDGCGESEIVVRPSKLHKIEQVTD